MKAIIKIFVLFSVGIFIFNFAFSQCTDSDSDGYYYEEGCGTPRDCNDANPNIYPGALETCNGYDDDCDASLDDGCDTSCNNPEKWESDLRLTYNNASSENPVLIWTGQEYAVSWNDSRDSYMEIYFVRIDSSGNKIGSDIRLTYDASSATDPSLVWTGSEYGVSWQDSRNGNYEIYFARLDSSGNKIGSDLRVTYDASSSGYPSLVWTGSEYGVSWQDSRDGNYEIYFARIDSLGNKIGSDVRVTNNEFGSWSPSLVWTGNEYGVSWVDDRDWNRPWCECYEKIVYFARLDPSGNKVGLDKRVGECECIWWSVDPSLIWTGNGYAISWKDIHHEHFYFWSEINFALLDSSGNKIGSDITVNADNDVLWDVGSPSIVWTGATYGIAWPDTANHYPIYAIYLAQFDSSGNRIAPNLRISNYMSSYGNLSLVWTGSKYGISWINDQDGNDEIYFARIGCCEAALDNDNDGWCFNDCDDDDNSVYPNAPELCDVKDNNCDGSIDNKDSDQDGYIDLNCINGSDCNDNDITVYLGAAELCDNKDNDCDSSIDEPIDADLDEHYALGSCGVPYNDCNDANPNIYLGATEVCNGYNDDCDGSLDEGCDNTCDNAEKSGSDVRVTDNGSNSTLPALVWTGSEYGVSWQDKRDGNYEIYFARLDASGNKIGSDARVTNNEFGSWSPSLVWTGSEYGMSWEDRRDGNYEIYFARIDSLGNKIGSDVRVTNNSFSSYSASLVWTGSGYGISWRDDQHYFDYFKIYFARLDSSGIKIGSDFLVTWYDINSYSPSLVWSGSDYGLSWQDYQHGNYEIYFARIDSSGNTIGSDLRVTNNASGSYYPTLAWTGSEYGISWHDLRDGNAEIYFTSIDSSGNKIGSDVRVTNAVDSSEFPSLVWTGTEYGISWFDYRNGNEEIYFARLDPSGIKISSDVRVTNNASGSYYPSLVWTGSEYAVSWHDYRDGNSEIYFARIGCHFEANAAFDPDSLNLKSIGKWMTCYIELPEGYSAEDIDISTIALSVDGSDPIYAETTPTQIEDYDQDGIADLMIKFDRSAIQSVAPIGDEVQFHVSGNLYSGERFIAEDYIKVF